MSTSIAEIEISVGNPVLVDGQLERGLEFVERCASGEDVVKLIQAFFAITAEFKLHYGAGGAWTGMGPTRVYRFFFNNWPEDWLAIYNGKQVFDNDPVVIESQRRMMPFVWADLVRYRDLGESAARTLDLARDYGWTDGLAIPIHGPSGYQGLISLATKEAFHLSPSEMTLLWVAALALHERCRLTPGMGMPTSRPRFTKRETDCMRWIAAGKTEWEAARLLGISPATVHFHVENVKRRLSTGRRTEAVALMVLHGAL